MIDAVPSAAVADSNGADAMAAAAATAPEPLVAPPSAQDAQSSGANAAGEPGRTDCRVQTYDTHLKQTHQLTAMGLKRPLPSIASDSLPKRASSAAAATIVGVAFKPTSTPVLDDTDRVAAFAVPDAQHRIGVGKVTGPLGWTTATGLVATCDLGRVTVTAAARTSAAQQPVTLDGKGRLRLNPAAAAVLRLGPSSQVLAVAVPAAGQLVLMSAAAALAQLTGPVVFDVPQLPSPVTDNGSAPTAGSRRTAVRGAFRPAEGAA